MKTIKKILDFLYWLEMQRIEAMVHSGRGFM
jgi:hypothetical protein